MNKEIPVATPVHFEQCSLNYFQLVAFQLNVRYAFGIRFPPQSSSSIASLWYQTVAQHGAHVQIALARLPDEPNKARPVLARETVSSGTKLNFASPTMMEWNSSSDSNTDRDTQKYLSEAVTNNLYLDHPNAGPPKLTLYTMPKRGDCVALVVNLNAALWDATTIRQLINSFLSKVNAAESKQQQTHKSDFCELTGWANKLQPPPSAAEKRTPKYLPIYKETVSSEDDNNNNTDTANKNAVEIDEIFLCQEGEVYQGNTLSQRRVELIIPARVINKLKLEEQGIQLPHLVMAVTNYTLAETYFKNHADATAMTLIQSCQVDPRTLLRNLHFNNNSQYLQAIGTLSHGRCMVKENDVFSGSSVDKIPDWIWRETLRIQRDLQQQTERGEAYTKIMELLTGRIDQTNRMGPVALELIDYGTMSSSSQKCTVELGHRFDACPHMSMVIHWEETVGLKLEAQLGCQQGRASTLAWLGRCREMFNLLAFELE